MTHPWEIAMPKHTLIEGIALASLALAALLVWLHVRESPQGEREARPALREVEAYPDRPAPTRVLPVRHARPYGRILSPAEGDRVGRRIPVRVEVADIPAGQHVWLAVEVGGLLWPKEPEVSADGPRWSGIVNEGGNPDDLAVSLWLVPADGQRLIEDWFARAYREGYPGLASIPGATRLDTVRGLRLE
jgi:hypothetical protein